MSKDSIFNTTDYKHVSVKFYLYALLLLFCNCLLLAGCDCGGCCSCVDCDCFSSCLGSNNEGISNSISTSNVKNVNDDKVEEDSCYCITLVISFLVDWFYNLPQGIGIGGDGKIDGVKIVNERFAKPALIAVYSEEDNSANLQSLKKSSSKWDKGIIARVTVKKNNNTEKRYTVYCKNANSIGCFGLFNDSQATEIEILSCGNNITDMRNMFMNCSSLTSLDLSKINTQNVTNMSYMFNNCTSLKYLDLSNWDTSAVTNMSYMFNNCTSLLSLNLSTWDTSAVTNMQFMFSGCSSLTRLNLSNFNTAEVKNMSYMFYGCSSLVYLFFGNFDTTKVTGMSYMFFRCFSANYECYLYCYWFNALIYEDSQTCLKIGAYVDIKADNNKHIYVVNRKDNSDNPIVIGIVGKNITLNTKIVNENSVNTINTEIVNTTMDKQIVDVSSQGPNLTRVQYITKCGKIELSQIVNKYFINAKDRNVKIYDDNDYDKDDDDDAFVKYLEGTEELKESNGKHIIARVIVKKNNNTEKRYIISCSNADSIIGNSVKYCDDDVCCYGLFDGSEAVGIKILSCGDKIGNMSFMFCNCTELLCLNLAKLNIQDSTDTSYIFYNCFINEATLTCYLATLDKIRSQETETYLEITNKAIINEIKNKNEHIDTVYDFKVKNVAVEREKNNIDYE